VVRAHAGGPVAVDLEELLFEDVQGDRPGWLPGKEAAGVAFLFPQCQFGLPFVLV
jgi:hypothetical protein